MDEGGLRDIRELGLIVFESFVYRGERAILNKKQVTWVTGRSVTHMRIDGHIPTRAHRQVRFRRHL